MTPDKAFDKTWAISTLQQALNRLRDEYAAVGKAELFDHLKFRLWSEQEEASCAEIAASLHLTEAAVKMAATRLRRRFREALRHEVRKTVADPAELDGEMRHLIAVLRDG